MHAACSATVALPDAHLACCNACARSFSTTNIVSCTIHHREHGAAIPCTIVPHDCIINDQYGADHCAVAGCWLALRVPWAAGCSSRDAEAAGGDGIDDFAHVPDSIWLDKGERPATWLGGQITTAFCHQHCYIRYCCLPRNPRRNVHWLPSVRSQLNMQDYCTRRTYRISCRLP